MKGRKNDDDTLCARAIGKAAEFSRDNKGGPDTNDLDIDGAKLAKHMLGTIGLEVKTLINTGWHQPSLTSISFGQDEAIARYVRNQKKAAEVCGIRFVEKQLSKEISKKEMIEIRE